VKYKTVKDNGVFPAGETPFYMHDPPLWLISRNRLQVQIKLLKGDGK